MRVPHIHSWSGRPRLPCTQRGERLVPIKPPDQDARVIEISAVEPVENKVVRLTLSDGSPGEVDIAPETLIWAGPYLPDPDATPAPFLRPRKPDS